MANKKRKKVLGDPKSFRGEFSFVNKDATNIDSKDHNAAVSWHVMNRYERWKKQEETKKVRASRILLPPSQQSTSGTPGTSTEEDVTYPPSPWQVENIEHGLLNASSPATAQTWMQNLSYMRPPEGFSFAPATGSYNEPAQTIQQGAAQGSMGFPPLVNHILSYAYGVVIPTAWPNESGKAKWTYEISQTWEEIATIRQDSCYASALLCFFATLMAASTNNKEIASQACFFQVQAMTELRRKLSATQQGSSRLNLQAILKLFSAETALDNTAAARVHLKMLRTTISAAGGVMTLDSWLRENILATDAYFALKYETRPLFPAAEWTPGPLSQPWKIELAQARMYDDLLPNVHSSIEHMHVRSLVADLRELLRVEQYINTHNVASEDNLLRWRLLRRYDCVSRLADHQLGVKIYPHLYVRPKLQLAICRAIALMTAMTLGCPEPVRSGLKMLRELRGDVMEARAEFDSDPGSKVRSRAEEFNHLMLWILYVGTLAEQVHPVASDSIWFFHESEQLALQLGLLDSESRQKILKSVLFSLALEDEIQQQRPRRSSESRKGVYEACGMSWRAPLDPIEQGQFTAEGIELGGKGKERAW